jgi:phage gp37-like protein
VIAEIELGMLAALGAASDSGAIPYRYRTRETYPADWDERFRETTEWNAPGAWAVFAGANSMTLLGSGDIEIEGAQFGLVVGAENLRDEQSTRHGGASAAEVGSYRLATDAVRLLSGNPLGLGIQGLQPKRLLLVRPSALLIERKVSLIAIQFETSFTLSPLDPDFAVGDFERLHLDWDVPPFGGIDGDPGEPGIQLPAPEAGPGRADASDHLILPQE